MTDDLLQQVEADVEQNLRELVQVGGLSQGQWLVIGTSTSEVIGQRIGTSGALNTAEPIYKAVKRVADQHGLHLAFQCCEHLNRALVVEEASISGNVSFEQVSVIPVPKAGGSMAAYAYRQLQKPVVVESIQAHAGIDIGDTLIGMHLRRVAVPVRPPVRTIGHAHVTMAYTRPKLIGGSRAIYTIQDAEQAAQFSLQADDCSLS